MLRGVDVAVPGTARDLDILQIRRQRQRDLPVRDLGAVANKHRDLRRVLGGQAGKCHGPVPKREERRALLRRVHRARGHDLAAFNVDPQVSPGNGPVRIGQRGPDLQKRRPVT